MGRGGEESVGEREGEEGWAVRFSFEGNTAEGTVTRRGKSPCRKSRR
jgi:hypothetical protein